MNEKAYVTRSCSSSSFELVALRLADRPDLPWRLSATFRRADDMEILSLVREIRARVIVSSDCGVSLDRCDLPLTSDARGGVMLRTPGERGSVLAAAIPWADAVSAYEFLCGLIDSHEPELGVPFAATTSAVAPELPVGAPDSAESDRPIGWIVEVCYVPPPGRHARPDSWGAHSDRVVYRTFEEAKYVADKVDGPWKTRVTSVFATDRQDP